VSFPRAARRRVASNLTIVLKIKLNQQQCNIGSVLHLSLAPLLRQFAVPSPPDSEYAVENGGLRM
jgi:hypothetical protein